MTTNIFIPKFLRQLILRLNPNRQKIFQNTGWLFLEKILRMFLGFFVSAWTIRYLGPGDWGLMSYSLAFMVFFDSLANFGLPIIVKRQLILQRENKGTYLGTAAVLIFAGGLLSLAAITLLAFVFHRDETSLRWMVLINSLTYLLRPFDMIEVWFDSRMESRYMVKVKAMAMIVSALFKVYLIVGKFPVIYFVWAFLLEVFVIMLGNIFFYRRREGDFSRWSFDWDTAKVLLSESWPIIFSGITIALYMKVDQIMLKNILGNEAVGSYSAAVKISEVWYFIPMVFSTSFFPIVMEAKGRSPEEFQDKMLKVYTLMTWTFIALGIPFIFFSHDLIILLFKEKYLSSIPILRVHFWTGLFVFWGVAQGIWDVAEGQLKFSSFRTLGGASMNILLNLFFIPRWGGLGAAYATVASQAMANCVINLFNKKNRRVLTYQLRSFFSLRKLFT